MDLYHVKKKKNCIAPNLTQSYMGLEGIKINSGAIIVIMIVNYIIEN